MVSEQPSHTPEDVLAVLRDLYREDPTPCDREELLQLLRVQLGFGSLGKRIRKILTGNLLAAVRRGVIECVDGKYHLRCRSIADYDRDFLKDMFLKAIDRSWQTRDAAMIDAARYLGFCRTGRNIQSAFRSIINGLIREGRLEASGQAIRRIQA